VEASGAARQSGVAIVMADMSAHGPERSLNGI
jgi:hypothetical protein